MDKTKVITIADNEEYLRQVSKEVDFHDTNLKQDIEKLSNYVKSSDTLLAFASIQIGIPKRLIYLKNTNLDLIKKQNDGEATEEEKNYNEGRILINPVILSRKGLTEYWETCASCLNLMGRVKRPYKIEVEYYDIYGNKKNDTFEGFESTVLSHEMDHLDGILHIDKSEEIIDMPREERKIFRKTHDYNIISITDDFEKLLKEGKKR